MRNLESIKYNIWLSFYSESDLMVSSSGGSQPTTHLCHSDADAHDSRYVFPFPLGIGHPVDPTYDSNWSASSRRLQRLLLGIFIILIFKIFPKCKFSNFFRYYMLTKDELHNKHGDTVMVP